MKVMRWGLTGATALLMATAIATAAAEEPYDEATAPAPTEASKAVVVDQELLAKVKEISKQGLFVETFEEHEVLEGSRWLKSTHEKYSSQEVTLDEYTVRTGHLEKDRGLVLDAPAKHYGLAVKLDHPLVIDGSDAKKELVVQYEVKLQKGLTCGGAYVKLLRQNEANNYSDFSDDSPFVIMFGPDKCGANDKVHFIFQHKNPITGKYEEKHMDGAPQIKSDRLTHLYTLVVRDDNTYEMFIDQTSVSKGSLYEDFSPSVLPDKEIDDPTDSKPADWVEESQIRDPDAKKPDDWDEDAPARIPDETKTKPEDWLDDEQPMIPDPTVPKPEDWDDEDDGEWVAPQVPNPKCEAVAGCGEWTQPTIANPAFKGKWFAPLIPNPAYKGEWAPRKIPNPDFFEDAHAARLDPIGALAVEVWTMSEGVAFDNFWLGNDFTKAEAFANLTFVPKHKLETQEEESAREKERKDLEDKRANDASYTHQLTEAMTGLWEYSLANPLKGFGSMALIATFTLIIAFFMCCAKGEMDDTTEEIPAKKDDDAGTAKSPKNAKAKESGSEDDGKQKLRQRKKAPVVKDD